MNFAPFAFQNSAPSGIVTTNLELNYDAGNTSSYPGTGTSWFNLQSTTLTSTLTNGPTFSTSDGGTVVFDGTNDYTTGPNNAMFDFGTGSFTIEAWVRINGNSALNANNARDGQILCCFPTSGSITTAYGFQFDGDATNTGVGLRFQKYGGGSSPNCQVSFTFVKNQLYQVGFKHDASTGISRFFINGVEYASTVNITGSVNSGGHPFRLASLLYPGFTHYLNGSIGIVRMYKGIALTSQQILQNYNANSNRIVTLPTIPTSGLSLWLDAGVTTSYPLTGTTWFDLSINKNNGTLTNGAVYDSANGGSIYFDGTNDFVTFPAVTGMPLGNSNYTIITFFKPTTAVRRNALILWGTTGSSRQTNAFRTLDSAESSIGGFLNFWWASDIQVNTALSNNVWFEGVATYNGSTRTIFKNNVSVGSLASSAANVTNQSTLAVGRTFGAAFEYMLGNISAVIVYNRTLNTTELTQVFDAYKNRYGI